MDKNEIITSIQIIFRNILENQNLTIDQNILLKDLKNWSSLNHVMIIDAIEKEFDIKFDLTEMIDIKSTDDICNLILIKCNE